MIGQFRDRHGPLDFVRQQQDGLEQALEGGDPPLRGREIEALPGPIEQPEEVPRGPLQLAAVRVGSARPAILIGIHAVREFEDLHAQALPQQQFDGALRGVLARRVRVEVDDDRVGMPPHDANLLGRQRGAAGRDDIADAGPPDSNDIHVPFDEHRQIALPHRRPGPVEVVEHRVLPVDRRFGRIQVLGLPVGLEAAAAERDQLAGIGVDREHDAVPETVVRRAVFALGDQARLLDLAPLEAPIPEMAEQGIARRRVTEPVLLQLFLLEAAFPQVAESLRSGLGTELFDIETLGDLVEPQQGFALARVRIGAGPLAGAGHLEAVLLSQRLERLEEAQALEFHQEIEDIAALPAAEALEDLQAAVHRKGRRLLGMERAKPDVTIRAALAEADMRSDDGNDVGRRLDLLREIHSAAGPPVRRRARRA